MKVYYDYMNEQVFLFLALEFTTYLNVIYGLSNLGCRQLEGCYRVNHGKSSVTSFSKKANEKTLNSVKKFFALKNVSLMLNWCHLSLFFKNLSKTKVFK